MKGKKRKVKRKEKNRKEDHFIVLSISSPFLFLFGDTWIADESPKDNLTGPNFFTEYISIYIHTLSHVFLALLLSSFCLRWCKAALAFNPPLCFLGPRNTHFNPQLRALSSLRPCSCVLQVSSVTSRKRISVQCNTPHSASIRDPKSVRNLVLTRSEDHGSSSKT